MSKEGEDRDLSELFEELGRRIERFHEGPEIDDDLLELFEKHPALIEFFEAVEDLLEDRD